MSDSILVLVVGLGLFVASGWFFWRSFRLISGAVRTQGIVTHVEISLNVYDGQPTQSGQPTIEFVDDSGKTRSFETATPSRWYSTRSVGKRVPVYYFTDGDCQAYAGRFVDLWFNPVLYLIMGSGIIFLWFK